VVDLLALLMLPMGWLHAYSKFIVFGLYCLANHVGLNM
jgi:hypothetical protein